MPYNGIPPSKTNAMDRCLTDLMADPKMKDKYKDPKERKSHAIAICHDSIMGTKSKKGENMNSTDSPVVINFYGNYWKEQVAQNDGKEVNKMKEEKVDVKKESVDAEVIVEKAKAKEGDSCKMADGKPGKMTMKDGKMVCIAETVKADVKVDVKKEEVKEPEVKVEVKEEVKPEEKAEEKADSTADLLKNVLAKIDILMAKKEDKKVEKTDTAPAEGASPKEEEAPKGGERVSPKEEEAKEDASPEGAEKVAKTDESLVKVNDSLGKLAGQIEKFDSKFVSLEERLTKLEKQPVPSKVVSAVAVSKADVNPSFSSENKEELTKIDKELADLEEMRKSDLDRYQRDRKWEVAWRLVDKKQAILSQAK